MKIWVFVKNAFKYNLIKGAAVIKVIQAILQLTGHQPWPDAQNTSVETLIDFVVGIVVLIGVGQAHDNPIEPLDLPK